MPNWKLEGASLVEDNSTPAPEPASVEPDTDDTFDPSEHTIDEVKDYVDAHPDEVDAVLNAEQAGKGRVTLVEWLEG